MLVFKLNCFRQIIYIYLGPPTELLQGYQGEELGVPVTVQHQLYHTGFTVWNTFEQARTPLSFYVSLCGWMAIKSP